MRSDLSEASSVMAVEGWGDGGRVGGVGAGEWGKEREEVPGVALPGGMAPLSFCLGQEEAEEGERDRCLLIHW